MFARYELFLRLCNVSLDNHEVVLVDEVAVVHVTRQTTAGATEGVEGSGRVLANFNVDGDRVAFLAQAGSCELGHPAGVLAETPTRVRRCVNVLRVESQPVTGPDRKVLVGLRRSIRCHQQCRKR